MNTAGPLAGIRVLDLGRVIAAPVATQFLADLGAEVIKVERPVAGDDARQVGVPLLPDREGQPIEGLSAYFLCANRNKLSVTADLTQPEGQRIVRELAARSHVLVENYKVGDLARYGLDYASLREAVPHLVYCSVTGYGHTGPLAEQPGFDGVFQARSGLMAATGDPEGEPQRCGIHVADYMTGQTATIAILAALREVEVNGGQGQHLDIALLDSTIAAMSTVAQRYLMSGEVLPRAGNRVTGAVVARLFDCADGVVQVSAARDDAFKRLVRLVGRTDLADDPRLGSRAGRREHERQIDEALEPIFRTRSVAEWIEALEADKIICAPIYTIDQALADPQARSRGLVVETPHPQAGSIRMLASPLRMSGTPVTRYAPPPLVGSDTDRILAEVLGYDAGQIARLRDEGKI
jgi:crotonobetainyl-CoA:carnitine CoA-transferase CaiB-like acyl-CoA transferase